MNKNKKHKDSLTQSQLLRFVDAINTTIDIIAFDANRKLSKNEREALSEFFNRTISTYQQQIMLEEVNDDIMKSNDKKDEQ